MPQKQIFQLKVILSNAYPDVWVRIQIPAVLTVVDLFVVIDYSMIVIDNYLFHFKFHKINKLCLKDKCTFDQQKGEPITLSEKKYLSYFIKI